MPDRRPASADENARTAARLPPRMAPRASSRVPLPLVLGFGVFVAGLGYLVVASLARREAPVFAPSLPGRTRAPTWPRAGDTLTLDATDGARWRYASLGRGRALAEPDTAGWDIAARRYRVAVPPGAALADLGPVPFDSARVGAGTAFAPTTPGGRGAMDRWYRYSVVTHLLTPGDHVYALRARGGSLWKLQVLGYYCPGLVAGCLTLRYAPLAAGAAAGTAAVSLDPAAR